MTAPMPDDPKVTANRARISANITKMQSAGAPDADIEGYIQSEGLQPVASPDADVHAARRALGTQTDAPPAETMGDRAAGVISSLYQGATLGAGNKITAGIRTVLPEALGGVKGFDFPQALKEQTGVLNDYRQRHPLDAGIAEIAGSLPTIAATGGASAFPKGAGLLRKGAILAGQGAKYGVASGALSSDTLKDVLPNALKSGVAGAIAAPVIGGVMGGAGKIVSNLGQRTGLTDFLAKSVGKVSPDLAESMGTRGKVNSALSGRQDILRQFGDNGTGPGRVQLDRIAATKAKAAEMYGIAQQDTKAISDPRLTAILQDPDVAKVFQTVKQMRTAQGQSLPMGAPPPGQIPPAFKGMMTPENYQAMTERNAARGINSGVNDLMPALGGNKQIEIPDPQSLATMKRYLNDAARGLNSPLNLKQDEARDVLLKAGQVRDILHEVSPSYKAADAFYSDAKGQEEAFAHGFDAFKSARNPSGENLPTHTTDAMHQMISTPRFPNEPPEALASRAAAFREGVKASAASGVRGAEVDKGLQSVMSTPALAGDQQTAGVRALGFQNPAEAQALEQSLATQRATANAAGPSSALQAPYSHHSAARSGIKALLSAPDQLRNALGEQLIASRQANPQAGIAASERGQALQALLKQLATQGIARQVATP